MKIAETNCELRQPLSKKSTASVLLLLFLLGFSTDVTPLLNNVGREGARRGNFRNQCDGSVCEKSREEESLLEKKLGQQSVLPSSKAVCCNTDLECWSSRKGKQPVDDVNSK